MDEERAGWAPPRRGVAQVYEQNRTVPRAACGAKEAKLALDVGLRSGHDPGSILE